MFVLTPPSAHRCIVFAVADKELDSVGARIVDAYKSAGLNRNQFSQRIGTTYQHVIRWEKGNSAPKYEYLMKIASATGRSVHWIATGEEPAGVVTEPPPAFASWLETHAPADLTDDERRTLESWRDYTGKTGPEMYTTLLSIMRMARGGG